ncbi:MAG: hypothetical protein H6760_03970 [Candidatus Nomurabacteria bacterium]|nr:MAG: hypothetical protein H6760_03970 [Candidatus Nomurabacteria bacterium]
MPRKKVTPKPSLPVWFWAFGIVVIIFGVWLSWPHGSSSISDTTLLSNTSSDTSPEGVFTDYFDAGWRSGDTNAKILVEASYFFPELASALEALPTKSGHQGEVADRLAILKPNTDTIVFYLTLASSDDELSEFDPEEIVSLSDDEGNVYPVQQWSEANSVLLPASEVNQRIGLVAFARTSEEGLDIDKVNPKTLQLTIAIPGQSEQTLTWDLGLLDTFLQSYER